MPSVAATHFAVTAPTTFQEGRPTAVVVQAENANNARAFSYAGTVQFSLANTDAAALLPATYTFGASDYGRHVFMVTLGTPGSQTITVTDTANSSISGSVSETVLAAPLTSKFVVHIPANVMAGERVNVTVLAQQADGTRAGYYQGTVAFSVSGGSATLPANYHFTPQDRGRHVFQVTFGAAGAPSLTVTDTVHKSITGSASTTVHPAAIATQFGLFGLQNPVAGAPAVVTVMALDANGQRVWGYTGTIQFTSSDTKAALPGTLTLTAIQFGRVTVPVTFNTAGTQTLTVTALTGTTIKGQISITVGAADPVAQFLLLAPPSASVGTQVAVVLMALDSNNVLVPYTGKVQFSSTDSSAALPGNYTFTAANRGRHVFFLTFNSAGTQTLTVTDASNPSLTFSMNVVVS